MDALLHMAHVGAILVERCLGEEHFLQHRDQARDTVRSRERRPHRPVGAHLIGVAGRAVAQDDAAALPRPRRCTVMSAGSSGRGCQFMGYLPSLKTNSDR